MKRLRAKRTFQPLSIADVRSCPYSFRSRGARLYKTGCDPVEFHELNRLVWSRDSRCPIAAEEVFSLYEQNRRFVDRERLSGREPRLIRELGKAFGRGFDLT